MNQPTMHHITDPALRRRLAMGLFVAPARPLTNRRRRARHWARRAANVRAITWCAAASVILTAAAVLTKLLP